MCSPPSDPPWPASGLVNAKLVRHCSDSHDVSPCKAYAGKILLTFICVGASYIYVLFFIFYLFKLFID